MPSQPGAHASTSGGIRYARQSAGEIEPARQRAIAAFRGGSKAVEGLFSENLLCGPGCWSKTNKSGLAERQDFIPVTSITPTSSGNVSRQGAMLMSAKARGNVAKALVSMVGPSPRIRSLTPSELELYWAVVPFDLKDPLFVAEAKGHRLVLNFGWSAKRNELAQVEDLSALDTAKILAP